MIIPLKQIARSIAFAVIAANALSGAVFMVSAQTSGRIVQWIQAEEFSETQGVSWAPITFKSQDSRVSLRGCGSGDWIQFDNVEFLDGEYDSIGLHYWSSWPQDAAGAIIRLRQGSPTGTILATFDNLRGTPAYGYGSPSQALTVPLADITGPQTVYLTFEGGTNICDVDKFALIGTMTSPSQGGSKTWYVDGSNGADNGNDGRSELTPFKTIQKAASIMKPGDRCLIRQGIYRETVKPLYTGMAGAPMTFEAYGNEIVVISGADPITGWTVHDGNIYQADMPSSIGKYADQVLVDGKMAWVARSPNVEEDYKPHPWLAWCGGAAGPQDARKWRGIADPLTIATKVCFGTNGTHTRIDGNFPPFDMSVSTGNNETNTGEYALPPALFGKPADFFKGGLISLHNYYWSTVGQITGSVSSGTQTLVTANAWNSVVTDDGGPGWISHVFGLLDSPNEWYRTDEGILYLWPPGSDDPTTHLVEAKRRTLGFDLRGKQYITVKNIRFLATSATLADAQNCVLDGCHFKYVTHSDVFDWYETGAGYWNPPWDPTSGYCGIYISGHDNIFRNGSVLVSARSGIILAGRNNTVTNSHIRDCNYTVAYQAGILVHKREVSDNTDGLTMNITHNTLAYCGRANVQIAYASDPPTPSQRTRVMYNEFGPAAFTTKETGSLSCQGSKGVEVAYNWFHGTAGLESGDIVMEYDFGARHYIVHHNVFWQGESIVQGFKTGFHWTFDWNDTGTSASTPNAGGAMCFNNTVVDASDLAHRDWDMDWPGYKKNNIMAMSDTTPWMFSDPVNRDYTLREGSRAIDAGVVVPGWVEEFEGNAPDLGAYEYGKPRWTAGADWEEKPFVYPPPHISQAGGVVERLSPAQRPVIGSRDGCLVVNSGAGRLDAAIFDLRGRQVAMASRRTGMGQLTVKRAAATGIGIVVVKYKGQVSAAKSVQVK